MATATAAAPARVILRLPEFVAQNVSNTTWAFAPLGVREEAAGVAASSRSVAAAGNLRERDLAAITWGMGTSALPCPALLGAAPWELPRAAPRFAPRSLANAPWAFVTVGYGDAPLARGTAREGVGMVIATLADGSGGERLLEAASLEDLITNLNATAWALNYMDLLTDDLDFRVHEALVAMARQRDRQLYEQIMRRPPPSPRPLPSREVFIEQGADPDVPASILVDLPDLCVVQKPPGWEVDCADVGTGIWLSTFLQLRYTPQEAPLVHYAEHQFGMVHRLDRVSSGLVLVGKTFTGFHSLGWQLNTGRLEREYVVVVNGWVPPDLRLVDAKVLHVHAEGGRESQVTEQGKPSQTRLTTLAHCWLRGQMDERLSVVVIQIRTGRRHQIRTHLAHVGHPTVADGKYMPREPFVRDKQWCPRNFLHRYRLGFLDIAGAAHEALAPLPSDLRNAAGCLVPAGARSAAALAEWVGGATPRAWATYDGLPAAEGEVGTGGM